MGIKKAMFIYTLILILDLGMIYKDYQQKRYIMAIYFGFAAGMVIGFMINTIMNHHAHKARIKMYDIYFAGLLDDMKNSQKLTKKDLED